MKTRAYVGKALAKTLVNRGFRVKEDDDGRYLELDSSADNNYTKRVKSFSRFTLLHETFRSPYQSHASMSDGTLANNLPSGVYMLPGDDRTVAHFRGDRLFVAGPDLRACERLFDLVAAGPARSRQELVLSWDEARVCTRIDYAPVVAEPEPTIA